MRKPLISKGGRFVPDNVRPRIEKVLDAFDRYLDASPYRFGRTKHAVMGPISKVLERSATGFWSVEDLSGYAFRIHEMHPSARGFVSTDVRRTLETGIQELLLLIEEVPITARAKVLEKLDYGLYYRRRKRASEWMDGIRKDFEGFLRSRYNSEESLREAWKDNNVSFGVYPSVKNKEYEKGKGKRKTDIDDFWRTYSKNNIEGEDE